MIFGNDRTALREMFFTVWEKMQKQEPLEPLESDIADVIVMHPEYHTMLSQKEKHLDKDFFPEFGETNPFMHMSLHLSIREQIATNRPQGIQFLFNQIATKIGNIHDTEHGMTEILMEMLWQAQRLNQAPDEQMYLEKLKIWYQKLPPK